MTTESGFAHSSIRPLVRYVDEDQAVIDVCFTLCPDEHAMQRYDSQFEVDFELTGEGQTYKLHAPLNLASDAKDDLNNNGDAQQGMVRFTVNQPHRWWPAGLGDQSLYNLTVRLIVDDHELEHWHHTLGLTSVRTVPSHSVAQHDRDSPWVWRINGQTWDMSDIVVIGKDEQTELIPVGATTLLVVRGHFGPSQLYDAADRAGILLLQAIPTAHTDGPASSTYLAAQIDRLTSHPSLAGWFIDQHDAVADRVSHCVHNLDPTRQVFRDMPMAG